MTPNISNLKTRATGYLWTWLTLEFKWHTCRQLLSRDAFASDLASRLCSVDDLAQLYHDVTTDLLDRHCPVVTVRRRVRPVTHAWFDAECRAARRRSRAAERIVLRLRRRSDAEVWLEVEAESCCMNTRNTSIGGMTLPPAEAATVEDSPWWSRRDIWQWDGRSYCRWICELFADKVASVSASTIATTPLFDVPYKSQLTKCTAVTVDEVG